MTDPYNPEDEYENMSEKEKEELIKSVLRQRRKSRGDGGSSSSSKRQKSTTPETRDLPDTNVRTRKDLSDDYLPPAEGCGRSPVERLEIEVNKVISEHQQSGCRHRSDVAAPFVCLLQSSGYGKTRAILEFAKTKKRLVYLVLKDFDQSWKVPRAVANVLEQMQGMDDPIRETKWIKFLTAVRECADKYENPEKLYRSQVTDEGALGDFFGELQECWSEKNSPEKSPLRPSLKVGGEASSSNCDDTKDQEPVSSPSDHTGDNKQVRLNIFYEEATRIDDDSLVVCFDEVSVLEEKTLYALRLAAKYMGILLIFSDTAASICKLFHPNHHSFKEKGGMLGWYTPPIFELNTLDLKLKYEDEDDYENLFCAGRPRWWSQLQLYKKQGKLGKECLENLIDYALNLLKKPRGKFDVDDRGKLEVSHAPIKMINPGNIALFACRFSLDPESTLSPVLVKHSLATVVGVSEDRTLVCSEYPSEPVLAEASAKHTTGNPDELHKVLEHVEVAVHHANKLLKPPRGDAGEMCAAALLGYAMDQIRSSTQYTYMSEPVTLFQLLSQFSYGRQDIRTDRKVAEITEQWRVNFTHFERPDCDLTEGDLSFMWHRRVAYYGPENVRGLDLLIPMRHSTSQKYGALRVQVKNYTNKIPPYGRKAILEKLHPSKCPPTVKNEKFSVGLLISVNTIDQCYELLKDESAQTSILQLATSFPCQADSVPPLALVKVSEKLRQICSQNTSKFVMKNNFAKRPRANARKEEQ